MGKKGAKRKTRWRSLSIGAPPGEEDEEEEVPNGYKMENGNGPARGDRNTQGGYSSYKRSRPYNSSTNTYGYGYGSLYNGQSKSSQAKNEEDPNKPKLVFNEEEYMRITTPRQDVLFKKGYLSRKKPLASTASTSATSATTTPSTNESQSAAHSTADGSETAEDQQLLDGSNGGEFAIMPEGAAQFAYGGFYDQVTGYYYEYPVMLVGPPVSGHTNPNVLAAMSCGPVPLRPVEWFNPQYMPESLQEQHPPPHSTDSQAGSCGSSISMDEVNGTNEAPATTEAGGSSGETRDEEVGEDGEGPANDEAITEGVQTPQIIPQIVPHMHMPPQHYVYPGHFMFGPPMVNMNGITVQNGAIVPSEALWAKRRKKKKRRKQRRPLAVGNTEDEEEEYSSEWESGSNWSQPAWSTSTTTAGTNGTVTSRPLNPEVQEFQFRSKLPVLPDATDAATFDSRDVNTPLLANSVDIEEEKTCEVEVQGANETRLVSSKDTSLSTIVNASSKDKLSENTEEITRVNEIRNPDSTTPHVTANELKKNEHKLPERNDKNGKVIDADSQAKSGVSKRAENHTHASSNGALISTEDTLVTETNLVDTGSERPDSPNNVAEAIIVDHLNNVTSEAEVVEELLTKSTGLSVKAETTAPINNNGHLSEEENHLVPNGLQEQNPKESEEINGQNVKSAASEAAILNSNLVSNSKRPENETSNKKGGNKNVKKGKAKTMDARKPSRNKRETRNAQRNDAASSDMPAESLQERKRSASPDTRQYLDSESSKSQLLIAKPGSRPTSPEINQTTTPINAETHRLPESYESLVTKLSPPAISHSPIPAGAPIAPPRRKYSAKGLKFVREPTPGPDLDTEVKSDNEEANRIDDSSRNQDNKALSTSIDQEVATSGVPKGVTDLKTGEDDDTKLSSGESSPIVDHLKEIGDADSTISRPDMDSEKVEAAGNELTSNTMDFVSVNDPQKSEIIPDISVEENVQIDADSIGISSRVNVDVVNRETDAATKVSNHPITDAVAAWLERTNSPEMFRVPMPISDNSDDSDLSETEIYDGDPIKQPSKNWQGNPMPALSVSNGSIDTNYRSTRSNVVTSGTITKTDTFDTLKTIERRREKDIDYNKEMNSPTNINEKSMADILRSVRVCKFTMKGSAAGMRVAENSRVDLNRLKIDDKRFKDNSKTNYIENIEMKVKSSTRSNDDITENGVEALENVKTYERGEIVVSLDGKLLTGTVFEPICLDKSRNEQDPELIEEVSESSSNRREAHKGRSRSLELDKSFVTYENSSEHETSPGGTINSLGSIEEPDVLECWETEIIGPVINQLKNNRQGIRLQVDGQVHDGEATEEENYDNHPDPATREHVKKYYRLAREQTISVEDELSERALKQKNSNNTSSNTNSPKRTTPNTPERMIECLCSEEIPIIVPLPISGSTKLDDKVVKNGKEIEPIDEAFEVYESCYTEKTRLAGVAHLNVGGSKIPLKNQEGPIPCKAVCCNIQ